MPLPNQLFNVNFHGDKAPILIGDKRTFRVLLDCNQYRNDMNQMKVGAEDVYGRKFRFFFRFF